MFYPLSSEYIKYLNEPGTTGMTYDQWQYKKMQEKLKNNHNENAKNHSTSWNSFK